MLTSGMDRNQDPSIGSSVCCHWANRSGKFFRRVDPKYLRTWLLKQYDVTVCSPGMEDSVEVDLWRLQTQLQMERLWCHETKRSKRVLLCCDVEFLYENSNVLNNKQVSTFQSENSISVKSRSREIFCQKCDLITPIITHSDWPRYWPHY